nr:hypothetical protein [Gammaproteobacteria bacterium]
MAVPCRTRRSPTSSVARKTLLRPVPFLYAYTDMSHNLGNVPKPANCMGMSIEVLLVVVSACGAEFKVSLSCS